jgi:hypothetical protein
MDARRLELYELLKPKLDEEPARALVLALPADPERLATTDVVSASEQRLTARMDVGFARVDARLAQTESTLTRRMITIMGAWTIVVGSTVGWVTALFR